MNNFRVCNLHNLNNNNHGITDKTSNINRKMHKLFESFTPKIQHNRDCYIYMVAEEKYTRERNKVHNLLRWWMA